ncbi:MAG: MgtC/SapB family protein [Chloroflexi bacterium]|nr:MAG: magnesium transporter MgtC [Phototrophicales bacterium]RMF78803.1 MAG: MgtC/SapB family protein [Chloroflexota bacterium]
MSLELQIEVSLHLALAAFLSMVIGLNRESLNQPAGLRTHMLVGLGAALFTIISLHAFPNSETARVAAQVVTGVGFLGAGTILQRKGDVHYLTTAASIWATAAVGMTAGVGAWFLAITATLISWFVLAIIRRAETEKHIRSQSKGNKVLMEKNQASPTTNQQDNQVPVNAEV